MKIQEWNDFGGFQLPEVSGWGAKRDKIWLVLSVVKDIEARLQLLLHIWLYSQFWHNLLEEGHDIFLWKIPTVATNKNSLKKKKKTLLGTTWGQSLLATTSLLEINCHIIVLDQ